MGGGEQWFILCIFCDMLNLTVWQPGARGRNLCFAQIHPIIGDFQGNGGRKKSIYPDSTLPETNIVTVRPWKTGIPKRKPDFHGGYFDIGTWFPAEKKNETTQKTKYRTFHPIDIRMLIISNDKFASNLLSHKIHGTNIFAYHFLIIYLENQLNVFINIPLLS